MTARKEPSTLSTLKSLMRFDSDFTVRDVAKMFKISNDKASNRMRTITKNGWITVRYEPREFDITNPKNGEKYRRFIAIAIYSHTEKGRALIKGPELPLSKRLKKIPNSVFDLARCL